MIDKHNSFNDVKQDNIIYSYNIFVMLDQLKVMSDTLLIGQPRIFVRLLVI